MADFINRSLSVRKCIYHSKVYWPLDPESEREVVSLVWFGSQRWSKKTLGEMLEFWGFRRFTSPITMKRSIQFRGILRALQFAKWDNNSFLHAFVALICTSQRSNLCSLQIYLAHFKIDLNQYHSTSSQQLWNMNKYK